ncbi:hypothetical protein NKG05_30025 [Oerskovia sp. M15]
MSMTDGARTTGVLPLPRPRVTQSTSRPTVTGPRASASSLSSSRTAPSARPLATELGLTPAGVRRHLALLETDGLITVHETGASTGMRGRPARRYVATNRGQSEFSAPTPTSRPRRCASCATWRGATPSRTSRAAASRS